MKSLIGTYLRDRYRLMFAFCGNTALMLLLVGLLLRFQGLSPASIRTNLGYALLLSAIVLTGYLGIDLAIWWPFARQMRVFLDHGRTLEALVHLPAGGTEEQKVTRELIARAHALAIAERERFKGAHERQLSFINLWVHQMKTPVTATSLLIQQAETDHPEELRTALAGIEEENGKLADGLELVLNMARLQDFALDYHIRRVDLLGSVWHVLDSRKRQFIRLSIFPEVEAADTDWSVLTDQKWNSFVIDQIVANALKYASQAGPPGQKLRIRLERSSHEAVLTISDQGPGIPAQDLPRVFEPFFTGENGRRFAHATGIGLYLAKQVLDHLGHEIAITSRVGEGTTVRIHYKSLQN